MGSEILNSVLKTEQELQALLDETKNKARARVEEVRRDTERELAAEEERLRCHAEHAAAEHREASDSRAAGLVEEAAHHAAELRGISDDELREMVRRHLPKILPGAAP